MVVRIGAVAAEKEAEGTTVWRRQEPLAVEEDSYGSGLQKQGGKGTRTWSASKGGTEEEADSSSAAGLEGESAMSAPPVPL